MPKTGLQTIRRAQILDAAFVIIAERSLEATRMRHIAQAAGVSQPSLHYYFATKDRLIVALLDRLLAEFKAEREARLRAAATPQGRLRLLMEAQRQIIPTRSNSLEVYYDFWVRATKRPSVREKVAQMYADWRADIRRLLEDGVRQGQFRADRVPMAPELLVSIFQGAALQYLMDPDGFDLEQYFAQADQVLAAYLCVPGPQNGPGPA